MIGIPFLQPKIKTFQIVRSSVFNHFGSLEQFSRTSPLSVLICSRAQVITAKQALSFHDSAYDPIYHCLNDCNYSPYSRSRGYYDSKRWKTGRFRQRVSDETLGSRDGFMCVLNHNPLGGADTE